MRFITETGSLYEVDQENKKIRRLNGKRDPSPRQGKDGEWQGYLNDLSIVVGEPVIIAWAAAHKLTKEACDFLGIEPGSDQAVPGRTTFTSRVVEIDQQIFKPAN